MAKLYLLPSTMSEKEPSLVLPEINIKIIQSLSHFIVEDLRTARRFLKACDKSIVIDDLTFYVLNEHTKKDEASTFIQPLMQGTDVGLMSDAGCPGVADPGADIVALAHNKNIDIVPLVGPSSILMAMMASGMNGQNFAFIGYLPVKSHEKQTRLNELTRRIYHENQCQVFIEAPYRNVKLFEELIKTLPTDLRLCIAADITSREEYIKTKSIYEWRKSSIPNLHKRPVIFIVGK